MTRGWTTTRSRRAFDRARRSLAGGVDSPVRAFGAVGGSPLFFARASGPYLFDLDRHRYFDLVNSWGAVVLGHAPARVIEAVRRVAASGFSFGAPSPREHELAERIRKAVPSLERLRFVNSGTEAVMSAIRVARGFTHRARVVKFEGGYHGHSDGLLARAGSGLATAALPDSAGVPPSVVADTLLAPYNDLDAVHRLFERFGDEIAAVLVEPIAGNMGVILPQPGFLPGLERLCRKHGALLVADEVITGFRLRRGAIHPVLGCHADLMTLGKIIGGGLPVGAYGGRADVMREVAPEGPVYQAGTLAGNPVVMAAGAATLDALTPAVYRRLEDRARELAENLAERIASYRIRDFTVVRAGSMFGFCFAAEAPRNYTTALTVDRKRYRRFFWSALRRGCYLPPSPLETAFLSAALPRAGAMRVAQVLGSAALEASRGTNRP